MLMATRNGARHLGAQLESLAQQTDRTWRLIASDDGSADGTWAMLETFQTRIGPDRVTLCHGPQRGATANFLSLVARTGPGDGCLAFCDQDDVWLPEKLARAVETLADAPEPTLYACAALIVDEADRGGRLTPAPRRPLGLGHALAENTLGGNTMVLSPSAAAALRAAAARLAEAGAPEAGHHDWLCYQVIAGAGGRVIYDPVPGIRYRQHPGNLVGSGQGKGRLWSRIGRLIGGGYARALRRQAEALAWCGPLGAEDVARLAALLSLRALPVRQRPAAILGIGIYRQRPLEDLALKALLLLGRV